jgi:hypothetical protein
LGGEVNSARYIGWESAKTHRAAEPADFFPGYHVSSADSPGAFKKHPRDPRLGFRGLEKAQPNAPEHQALLALLRVSTLEGKVRHRALTKDKDEMKQKCSKGSFIVKAVMAK